VADAPLRPSRRAVNAGCTQPPRCQEYGRRFAGDGRGVVGPSTVEVRSDAARPAVAGRARSERRAQQEERDLFLWTSICLFLNGPL